MFVRPLTSGTIAALWDAHLCSWAEQSIGWDGLFVTVAGFDARPFGGWK
jgi:hypothetical protein